MRPADVGIGMTISVGLGGAQFILNCRECGAKEITEGTDLEILAAHLSKLVKP